MLESDHSRVPSSHAAPYNHSMDPDALGALARRHGVRLLIQFGSSATGRTHAHSDVDLAAWLERIPESWDAETALIADLQALVPGRDVDVTLINRADPLLLKQIAEHGRPLYGSPRDVDAFNRYAFKRYQDHRPYLALEARYVQDVLDRTMR